MPRYRLSPRHSLAPLLLLAACHDLPQTPVDPRHSADLVLLADGTTMDAREGSLERAIADWIVADIEEVGRFELELDAFVAGTADLSPSGLERGAALGFLLHSAPDVQLRPCIPFGPDERLAAARATALARFLEGRDIPPREVEDLSGTAGQACHAKSPEGFPFLLRRRPIRE